MDADEESNKGVGIGVGFSGKRVSHKDPEAKKLVQQFSMA